MPEIMDGMSMDLERANMDKLRSVFPECFAEEKLDVDKLLSLCGRYVSNDFEKYKFEWKGKFKNQEFQTDAVNSVVDLFLGQEKTKGTFSVDNDGMDNFLVDTWEMP